MQEYRQMHKKSGTLESIPDFFLGVTGVQELQELQTNAILISLSPSDGRDWGGSYAVGI